MMMKLQYENSKKEERKRSVPGTIHFCLVGKSVGPSCRPGWNCVIIMKEGGWGRGFAPG